MPHKRIPELIEDKTNPAVGIAMAIGLLLAAGQHSNALSLVKDGQSTATIVVPKEASPTERFAAQELQRYVLQISGAILEINSENASVQGPRLLIGTTSSGTQALNGLEAKDPEAFLVRVVNDDLLLIGASDRATLYAVYDFLEQELGCRWLAPDPDWEVIPDKATIRLADVDRVEAPAMKYRFLRMAVAGEPGSRHDHTTSWAVKQKINIASGWPPDKLPQSFVERGGFRAWMGPHTMIENLLPASKHFDEHPEWYALVRGKRRRLASGREQLCTTNPEVVKQIAEGIGRVFGRHPETDFMGMGQADSTAFCECEKCTALDTGDLWTRSGHSLPVVTERWLHFVNAVARQLQKSHPGKKVYTLAYHQTFRPPDPKVIKPEPNVMIQVVNSRPNYVCFVHRFENKGCPHHVKFCQGLEDWVAMTPGGVMVYEYTPHSTFCSMPYPAPHKFVDDINYLHRLGVVGYEGQSTPNIWGTYGLTMYAIAKATWDAGADADELVADYCDHAFGRASQPMQQFVKTIERGLVAADHITDGIWTYMTPQIMAEARRHIDAAHAAADTPEVKRRLRVYEIGFHYGELGSQAWRTARKAVADHDAKLLQQAIDLAEAAGRYCLDEQGKDPHYAAIPGKLTSVHVRSWKRQLATMK